MKTYTCGERNAQGRRFWAYEKTRYGVLREIWVTPERWERQKELQARCVERWRKDKRNRVHLAKEGAPLCGVAGEKLTSRPEQVNCSICGSIAIDPDESKRLERRLSKRQLKKFKRSEGAMLACRNGRVLIYNSPYNG